LRNPAVQQDLLSKSIEERALIASGARSESKQHTRETAADIMDVTQSEVVRVMTEKAVTLMIHGHTHRPASHDFMLGNQQATRIVLGDWDAKGWYLSCDETGNRLIDFNIRPGKAP